MPVILACTRLPLRKMSGYTTILGCKIVTFDSNESSQPWGGHVSEEVSHRIWLQCCTVSQDHLSWPSLTEQVDNIIAELALLAHCGRKAVLQCTMSRSALQLINI